MRDTGYLEINGRLVASGEVHISALDRGFALSDGIFETIRVSAGKPFRLARHLARMQYGAGVLQLPLVVSEADLGSAIDRVLRANALSEAVVRVTVSRGVPSERGLLPPPVPSPTVVIQAARFLDLPAERVANGYRVATSEIRRNEYSPTSRIKACNYLDNVLARIAAHDQGADDALLLNTSGYVACCSSSNVFILQDGVVRTPSLGCGVLCGITRELLKEVVAARGLGWEETELTMTDLTSADEAFLSNSVAGVVAVTALDGCVFGSGAAGPVALKLRNECLAIMREVSR
jgi:branched-chain amino acid aminotransferase